jgi:hypothetical protein
VAIIDSDDVIETPASTRLTPAANFSDAPDWPDHTAPSPAKARRDAELHLRYDVPGWSFGRSGNDNVKQT